MSGYVPAPRDEESLRSALRTKWRMYSQLRQHFVVVKIVNESYDCDGR
jgi:hypothetical protein